MLKKVFPVILLLFAGCDLLFWTSRTTFSTARWIEKNRVAEVILHFKERSDWRAVSGSTLKKDFQTELRIIQVENQKGKIEKTYTLPGEQRGNLFLFGGFLLISLHSEEEKAQKLTALDLKDGSVKTLGVYPDTNSSLESFVVSPDSKKAVILSRSGDRLSIALTNLEGSPATAEIQINATLAAVAWNVSSSMLYIKTPGIVLSWNLKDRSAVPAFLFPSCFRPASLYGDEISPEGLKYFRSSPEEEPLIEKTAGWKGLESIPLISDPGAVGRGCL